MPKIFYQTLESNNMELIQDEAKLQAKGGADFIDINPVVFYEENESFILKHMIVVVQRSLTNHYISIIQTQK